MRDDGEWELDPTHDAVRSAREAVRERITVVRRWAEMRPDPVATYVGHAMMYVLERRKLDVARQLGSRVMPADAIESITCGWLSLIVVMGLVANWLLAVWWVDAVTSLAIVWFVVKEAREAWTGDDCCSDEGGWRLAPSEIPRRSEHHPLQAADLESASIDVAWAALSRGATKPFDAADRIVETGRENDCFKKFENSRETRASMVVPGWTPPLVTSV